MTAILEVTESAPASWTTERYRQMFGWLVEQRRDSALLALGRGMVAVVIPDGAGPAVAARLLRNDACGPVLVVKGAENRYWVFLADPNGLVTSRASLPRGVRVLDCPAQVPVPVGDTPSSDVRWVVPPNASRRWLPALDAVLSVIHGRSRVGFELLAALCA